MTLEAPVLREEAPRVEAHPRLQARLGGLRRKALGVSIGEGLALCVSTTIEWLAVAMFVDWSLDLPRAVRLLLLIALCATLAWIVVRKIIIPIVSPPADDDLALRLEKAYPQFRSRLISAVQFPRPNALPWGASAGMARATVEQAAELAAGLDFGAVISADKLKKLGALSLILVALGVLAFVFGGSTANVLLKRSFLAHLPVPRNTRVEVVDGNKLVGRGDTVRLEAMARGVVPARGRVQVNSQGRRVQEFSLEPARDNRARFSRTLENVQETFQYVVFLNDGRSAPCTVKVLARPMVASIECEQIFPAYTGLKPVRRSLGDLALLAGSVLKLNVTATKSIRQAAIKLAGPGTELPLQSVPDKPVMQGQFTVPSRGMTGFSIQLIDTDGMASKDSAIYRVEIIPDKPPVVRLTYPERKEELITRRAMLIVGMDVLDDFAVAGLRLRYKVEPAGPEKAIELDAGDQPSRRLKHRYEWKFADFSPLLAEGSRVEFWLEAQDNNNATGPGVGTSEHQFVRVVSDADKRADLLNRAGDYLGSISEVAGDQEKLNVGLGTLIREKIRAP